MNSALRRVRVGALSLVATLAACGGGGSGSDADSGIGPTQTGLRDSTMYSAAARASLASAEETVSVTTHTVSVAGTAITYNATAGHLRALAPTTGTPEASMFYVAYTVPSLAGAARPIVYFYNGGPGSSTVWLHLGSFAPRRIVTNDPALSVPQPFQLVDNAESLIDVADLVFVDAVGTGYSEAIAPSVNQSFWSVDGDAALMRDFIARYASVNGRQASPSFLFGESYGTTRSAVLAHLMVAASMRLDGVILQSSILDYNANCDIFSPGSVSCEGSFPSYGMIGAWFSLTHPLPADADGYATQLRAFASASYGPAAEAYVQSHALPSATLLRQFVDLTGAPLSLWTANPDLDADSFREGLVGGKLLGRYDARMAAPNGSAAANSGDPSSVIDDPFAAAAASLFANELLYNASAPYTTLSDAIDAWDFSHDGRPLPDTIPDLAAALATSASLRVLSLAGYHDLATAFHQTELDLARLGAQPRLAQRVYPGGHMIYLDDGSRPRMKADVAAFIAGTLAPAGSSSGALAAISAAPEVVPSGLPSVSKAGSTSLRLDRHALPQGGDPSVPIALRVAPAGRSPTGAALRALVDRKIADRAANPYR